MEWWRRHLPNRSSLAGGGLPTPQAVLRTMPRRSPPRWRPKIRCTTCEAANHDLHVSQHLWLRPTVQGFRRCTRAHTTRSAQLLDYTPCAPQYVSPSSAPQQRRPCASAAIITAAIQRRRYCVLRRRRRRRCRSRLSLRRMSSLAICFTKLGAETTSTTYKNTDWPHLNP